MWLAVLITVIASAGNNIGKVLQKKATRGLPRLALERKVIAAYLSNTTWVTGLVIDVGGALLMLIAVAKAPVSVVQPVSGCGLAILAVFSHFYLHEAMFFRDWIGVALAGVGTIGVSMTGEDSDASKKIRIDFIRILWFVFWLLLLLVVLEWVSRKRKGSRKAHEHSAPITPATAGHSDVLEEMAFGIQAGSCFGMSAAACKTGFMLASTTSPLCAPLGIAVGVSLSSSGFFCQNRGFKEGRAVVVSTCADVANIVSGVLVGMMALGEELPQSRRARNTRLGSWVLIVAGIVILVNAGKAAPLFLREPMRVIRRMRKGTNATPRPPTRPPHMTRSSSASMASTAGASKYNDD